MSQTCVFQAYFLSNRSHHFLNCICPCSNIEHKTNSRTLGKRRYTTYRNTAFIIRKIRFWSFFLLFLNAFYVKRNVRFLVILYWPKNTNQKQTLLHIELLYSSNCDVSTVSIAVGNKITEFPFIVILQQSHQHHHHQHHRRVLLLLLMSSVHGTLGDMPKWQCHREEWTHHSRKVTHLFTLCGLSVFLLYLFLIFLELPECAYL